MQEAYFCGPEFEVSIGDEFNTQKHIVQVKKLIFFIKKIKIESLLLSHENTIGKQEDFDRKTKNLDKKRAKRFDIAKKDVKKNYFELNLEKSFY